MTSGPRSLISVCSPEVGSITARLVRDSPRDPGEVGEDRLLGQPLHQPRAGGPAGQAGRDHGAIEQLQRAGDVDSLAAGRGARLDRAVAMALAEAGDGDGAVDRGVQGDGEDHSGRFLLARSCRLRILSSCIWRRSSGVRSRGPRSGRLSRRFFGSLGSFGAVGALGSWASGGGRFRRRPPRDACPEAPAAHLQLSRTRPAGSKITGFWTVDSRLVEQGRRLDRLGRRPAGCRRPPGRPP